MPKSTEIEVNFAFFFLFLLIVNGLELLEVDKGDIQRLCLLDKAFSLIVDTYSCLLRDEGIMFSVCSDLKTFRILQMICKRFTTSPAARAG